MARHYHIFVSVSSRLGQHGIYPATLSTYQQNTTVMLPRPKPEPDCAGHLTTLSPHVFGVYNLFVTTVAVVVYHNTRSLLFESFTKGITYIYVCGNGANKVFQSEQRFGRYRRIGRLPDGRLVEVTHQWHDVYLNANLLEITTKAEQIDGVACREHPFGDC